MKRIILHTQEGFGFNVCCCILVLWILIMSMGVFQNPLGSDYDLERIIDDWILMGFLVGNDFIPHLPHLHINHDALPLLYKTYMSVLPSIGGESHRHKKTTYFLLMLVICKAQERCCDLCSAYVSGLLVQQLVTFLHHHSMTTSILSFTYVGWKRFNSFCNSGYLNENGHLNLRNFEKYLEKLSEVRHDSKTYCRFFINVSLKLFT